MTIETDDERLCALLATHPAVARTQIRREGTTRLAFITPRVETAPLLYRACALEDKLPSRVHLFEVGNILPLVGINKTEAEFLYDEILTRDCYLLTADLRLPEKPVVIDVGANIGAFAVVVGKRYPGARILAVEPITLLCAAIQLNAELHDIDIAIANVAASDAAGFIDLQFYPSNTVMSGIKTRHASAESTLRKFFRQQNPDIDNEDLDILVEECLIPNVERCRADHLTNILTDHYIDHVDLLKIDAEHSEVPVLRGIGEATWSKIDRIIVEVHDVDQRLDYVSGLLSERGFSVSAVDSELETTGCWMVAGKKPNCYDVAPHPKSVKQEVTRHQLVSELTALLTARGEPIPDRMFIVSHARLSDESFAMHQAKGLAGGVDRP